MASVSDTQFEVSVIPHTGEETTLLKRRPGDLVNLENDIVGKYVEKLLRAGIRSADGAGGAGNADGAGGAGNTGRAGGAGYAGSTGNAGSAGNAGGAGSMGNAGSMGKNMDADGSSGITMEFLKKYGF